MTPILFIHGFPFDGGMWDGQANAGFPMLAPDLPGFGPNPVPLPENPSIESYAEFVHQFILARKIRPVVAGLSMGGYVLLALLRAHPEATAGAVLIDTRAEADTPEGRANRLKSIEDVRHSGTASLIDGLMPKLLAKAAAPAVVQRTRANMNRQSPAAVITAQSAMAARRDQSDLLPHIAIPTLIIVGTEDVITPPQAARTMHHGIRNSTLLEIPGTGHMSPLEAPVAVNAALAQFAGSCRSGFSG